MALKKYNITIFTIIMIIVGCRNQDYYSYSAPDRKIVELDSSEDGIYFEAYPDNIDGEVPYLSDNSTYLPCKTLIYEFNYFIDDVEYCFKTFDKKNPWDNGFWDTLRSEKKTIENVDYVKYVGLSCIDTFHLEREDYSQTYVFYSYMNKNEDLLYTERTGVRENYKNIWLHPPRIGPFKMAFVAPWPYLSLPLEIDKEWSWQRAWAGTYMGYDSLLVTWEGSIVFDYSYRVMESVELSTKFGVVKCFRINALGKNSIGENSSEFYFNSDLGFIKMTFTSLDGRQKIVLNAIDYYDDCSQVTKMTTNWKPI